MVNLSPFKPNNPREQLILFVGFIAILIGVYFFVIEPLDKKTQALQQTGKTRMTQLSEMQNMASQLLSSRDEMQQPMQLLTGKIANETLENGQRVIKTQPLDNAEAKQLLRQLAPHGKVAIQTTQNATVEVWFWPK